MKKIMLSILCLSFALAKETMFKLSSRGASMLKEEYNKCFTEVIYLKCLYIAGSNKYE